MTQKHDQLELPLFQPDDLPQLLGELEAKKHQLQQFGEAIYHATKLHEDGIRNLSALIQSKCIHPTDNVVTEVKFNAHKNDEYHVNTCTVCQKVWFD